MIQDNGLHLPVLEQVVVPHVQNPTVRLVNTQSKQQIIPVVKAISIDFLVLVVQVVPVLVPRYNKHWKLE
jgi:hypothetical protein